MSGQENPIAEGQLNKKNGSAVVAHHESVEIYFHHEDEELIFLTESAASELDSHARELMVCVDEHHQASEDYSLAIEKYGITYSQPAKNADLASLENRVSIAEKTLEVKKKALLKKLGKFNDSGAGYEKIVELIPIATKNNQSGRQGKGSKYIYVKKAYKDKLGKGIKHTVSLKAKDKASSPESIFKRDRKGNITSIDTKKMKEQLAKQAKKEFKPNTAVQFLKAADIVKIDATLTGWADCWNAGENVDISAGAQFMRFTSNLGASGEWDPVNGKLKLKAEFGAVLSVASGTADATIFMPDRIGWPMKFTPTGRTSPVNMGMLRVYIQTLLIGFAGASAQAEAQFQITTINNKQVLMGKPNERLPRFSERRVQGAEFHKQMDENDEGISASGEIFGGARTDFTLSGGVQWLQPPALTSHQGKTGKQAEAAAEYVDFCSISESIAGMAGIGIGGTFQCDFVNGKFCFKIAASLCVGLGAKGSFRASVSYDKLRDFGNWLVYQLYGVDYAFFELITKDAFKTFSKLCVMLLSDIQDDIIKELKNLTGDIESIKTNFNDLVESMMTGLKASEKRNTLANNILATPQALLSYTPESKGILLYLLTRHATADHIDIGNRGDDFIPDIYHDRKKAIIVILTTIQTQREWFQVFSHRTADGSDLANGNPALKYIVAQRQMNETMEFLQEGINKDKEMDKIYRRLKETPAWGYALAMNNTLVYRLHSGNNPFYPQMGQFGPRNDIVQTV
ncbi:ATPase [Yersinia pseudotuberculosis]